MGEYYDFRALARGTPKSSSLNTIGNSKGGPESMFTGQMDTPGSEGKSKIPCRACTDFRSWTKASSTQKPIASKAAVGSECPLGRSELGNHTWNFLHTMAAYYPENPTKSDQNQVTAFFKSFGYFYPCDHCAQDFRNEMQRCPPKVSSRWELSTWLCEQHNIVNKKLGKTEFDCSKVLERWLHGPPDGRCS